MRPRSPIIRGNFHSRVGERRRAEVHVRSKAKAWRGRRFGPGRIGEILARSVRNKPLSPCPLPAAMRRERDKRHECFAQLGYFITMTPG